MPDRAPGESEGGPDRWAVHGFVLLAVLAALVGGGALTWQFGLLLIGAGALLLRARFQRRDPAIAWAAAAAGLLPLLGFLPPGTFGDPPAWRVLAQDLGLPIAARTTTPQPVLTAESALLSAFAVVLVAAVPALRWTPDLRRGALRVLCASVAGLAIVALVREAGGWELPFWPQAASEGIGPFANRNAFGTLLATFAPPTIALACGEFARRRLPAGVIWFLAWLVLLAATVLNGSRGGILLFAAGSGAWIVAAVLRARSMAGAVSAAAGIALTALVVAWVAPEISDRFHVKSPETVRAAVSGDGRVPIYRDTLAAIAAAPIAGCGLGNFSAVFALQRQAVVSDNRVLHPESDWLWLAHEGGLPYAAAWALLVVLVVRRALAGPPSETRPTVSGPPGDRLLGWAAATGISVFLLHSLFDIPGHFPAVGLSVLLLVPAAAIGTKAESLNNGEHAAPLSPWGFRCLGTAMLLGGGAWLTTALGGFPVMPAAAAKAMVRTAWTESGSRTPPATDELESALATLPMDWRLHFLLGREGIRSGELDRAAQHFRAARVLAPEGRQVALAEASEWRDTAPERAVAALQTTALESPDLQGPLFQEAIRVAQAHPEAIPLVEGFASMSPHLMVAYLRAAPPDDGFARVLDELLAASDSLQSLAPDERRSVLDAWLRRGDPASLVEFLDARQTEPPDKDEIEVHALAAAKAGDFTTACERGRAALEARGLPIPATASRGSGRAEWEELRKALRTGRRKAD